MSKFDPQAEMAKLAAEADQAKAAAGEIAGTMWAFFNALNLCGFTREEALALTLSTFKQNATGAES